jgi:hypothetical protein
VRHTPTTEVARAKDLFGGLPVLNGSGKLNVADTRPKASAPSVLFERSRAYPLTLQGKILYGDTVRRKLIPINNSGALLGSPVDTLRRIGYS